MYNSKENNPIHNDNSQKIFTTYLSTICHYFLKISGLNDGKYTTPVQQFKMIVVRSEERSSTTSKGQTRKCTVPIYHQDDKYIYTSERKKPVEKKETKGKPSTTKTVKILREFTIDNVIYEEVENTQPTIKFYSPKRPDRNFFTIAAILFVESIPKNYESVDNFTGFSRLIYEIQKDYVPSNIFKGGVFENVTVGNDTYDISADMFRKYNDNLNSIITSIQNLGLTSLVNVNGETQRKIASYFINFMDLCVLEAFVNKCEKKNSMDVNAYFTLIFKEMMQHPEKYDFSYSQIKTKINELSDAVTLIHGKKTVTTKKVVDKATPAITENDVDF